MDRMSVMHWRARHRTILLDPEEQKMLFRFSTRRENLLPSECQAFQGELEVRTESGQEKKEISFHEYSTISGRGIASSRLLNVVYLAPFDHLRGGMLSSIIKNDSYKDLCVGILQLFDPGITDPTSAEETKSPTARLNVSDTKSWEPCRSLRTVTALKSIVHCKWNFKSC